MTDNIQPIAWQVYSGHDALREREPVPFVVDGFFQAGSVNIVYGPPGSLKTIAATDCAACVASGDDWLIGALGTDGQGIKVNQSPVLHIDMDNGTQRTHERIGAAIRAHNVPPDNIRYMSMPVPLIDVTQLPIMSQLIIMARDDIGARMIILDNLGLLAAAANTDVNNSQMAQVMGALRMVAEQTGAAVIVIHHQRKANGSGPSKVRVGETLLGHTSIEASLDLALLVMRDGNSQDIILRHTKSRGAEPPMVGAKFYYSHKPGTNELDTAWLKGVPVGGERMEDLILSEVNRRGHVTKGLLIDTIREQLQPEPPGVNQVRNRIDQLIVEGALQESKDGKQRVVSRSNGQYEANYS